MSEQRTKKTVRPTPAASTEVPTSVGTLRVLPFTLSLLVGVFRSPEEVVSDEELGRRALAEVLRRGDQALTDNEWQRLTPDDMEAVVRAAMARLVPGDVTAPPLAALGSSVRQSGKSLVKPIIQAADRFSQALATLPKNVVDQINLHSAALDKASESLRTSAAAFIKSDRESQERFKAMLKEQADPLADGIRSRSEGKFSPPPPPRAAAHRKAAGARSSARTNRPRSQGGPGDYGNRPTHGRHGRPHGDGGFGSVRALERAHDGGSAELAQ